MSDDRDDRYRRAATILHDVAKPMRVLSALAWDASIREEFLASGGTKLPQPTYQPIDPEPGARRRRRRPPAAPPGRRRRLAEPRGVGDRGDRTDAVDGRHAVVPRLQPPAVRRADPAAALRSRDAARAGAAGAGQPRGVEGRAPDAAAGPLAHRRAGRRPAEGRRRRALRRRRSRDPPRRRVVGQRRRIDEPDQDPPRRPVHVEGRRAAPQPRGLHPRRHRQERPDPDRHPDPGDRPPRHHSHPGGPGRLLRVRVGHPRSRSPPAARRANPRRADGDRRRRLHRGLPLVPRAQRDARAGLRVDPPQLPRRGDHRRRTVHEGLLVPVGIPRRVDVHPRGVHRRTARHPRPAVRRQARPLVDRRARRAAQPRVW